MTAKGKKKKKKKTRAKMSNFLKSFPPSPALGIFVASVDRGSVAEQAGLKEVCVSCMGVCVCVCVYVCACVSFSLKLDLVLFDVSFFRHPLSATHLGRSHSVR